MDTPRYVAAIEISSSKVIGAVGKIYPDGKLDVLAVEQESRNECVRYGIVQNVEDTAYRIQRVISRLERNSEVSPNKITGIFVGLSGRSLRAIATDVELRLPEETVIDSTIVRQLREKAESKAIDSSLEVIDAVPRSFTIGQTKTKEPTGNLGNNIKATYDLIVCRPQIKRNIERTGISSRLNVKINGFIVTHLAAGALIPNESEKQLGCMLVDIGAETTCVSIYKDGHLEYFATLPLGSRNITRDITSQSVLEDQAESIKIENGNAMPSSNSGANLNIHGVDKAAINEIIVARTEEIMVNIIEQINYAGLKDSDLPGGIILIGGGSRLHNLEELIRETTNMPVKRGQLPAQYISYSCKTPSMEAMQVVGILYNGATHSYAKCLSTPEPDEIPDTGVPNPDDPETEGRPGVKKPDKPRQPGRISGFFSRIGKILTPGNEDSDLEDNY